MPLPHLPASGDPRPTRSWLIRGALVLGGCAALTAASCGSSPVSSGLGIDWGRSALVERPAEAFDFGPDGTMGPPAGPGTAGHPGHFPGQAIMADVIATPKGALVSVGYVYPGWHPVAWTSPNAVDWSLHRMGAADFTFPVALAVGLDGTIVAVGRSGNSPVAWTSSDGADWQEHPVPRSGDGLVAERMTTVLATPDGFIAGGSVGPESFDRHARFWRSPDGMTWQALPDDPAAFADAEVRSIVRLGTGYVAIGALGTAQQVTGSVAWTSPDGVRWTPEAAPDLRKGRAVSVVEAPFGGLVAVGSDLDEGEALVWTSPDGRDWSLVPGESSRRYDGKIRMTDVTAATGGLIAVGNYINLQYGTARAWVSRDAIHWQPSTEVPVMEQGEPYAVAAAGPGAVSVGSVGAPDDYIPTVWLSPAR